MKQKWSAEGVSLKEQGKETVICQSKHLTDFAVKEEKDDIIFLRKLVPGGTDKSYGIHVAKLAGMPKAVIERAKEIQAKLEGESEMDSRLHQQTKQSVVAQEKVVQRSLLEL